MEEVERDPGKVLVEQQVSGSHQQLLPIYVQELRWVALGLPGGVHGCD